MVSSKPSVLKIKVRCGSHPAAFALQLLHLCFNHVFGEESGSVTLLSGQTFYFCLVGNKTSVSERAQDQNIKETLYTLAL